MYTLRAVFVHFNHFVDLKLNFHSNPYNLASSPGLPVGCCESGWPVRLRKYSPEPRLFQARESITPRTSTQKTCRRFVPIVVLFSSFHAVFFSTSFVLSCVAG